MNKRAWIRKATCNDLSKGEVLEELKIQYYKVQEEVVDRGIKRFGQLAPVLTDLYVALLNTQIDDPSDKQLWDSRVDVLQPSAPIGVLLEHIEYNFDAVIPNLTDMLLEDPAKYAPMYSHELIKQILEDADNQIFYDAKVQLGKRLGQTSRSHALPVPVYRDLILTMAKEFSMDIDTIEEKLDSAGGYNVSLFCDMGEQPTYIFAISPCTT